MNIIKQIKDSNGNNIYPIGYAQGGMKMDLLWTNPSPTASFAAQTVSLDLSDYRCFVVYIRHYTNDNSISSAFLVKSDIETMLTAHGQTGNWACRYITSITNNGVIFGNGKASNGSVNDQAGIPYQIYGIKTSYVVPTSVHGLQYVEV